MYKMSKISKEAYKKCEIETIDNRQYFRLSKRDLQIESGYSNWAAIFDKYDPNKQKYRYELMPSTKFQLRGRFVRNDLAQRKIRSHRLASEQFLEFKEKLELDPNEYSFDEQDIISALQVAFEGEIMHTQYFVQNRRLDFYFSEYKLGVKIDEYGQADRDFENEQSRELMIEKKLGCKIIRINPDAADFSIYRLINQISMHIKQSTKKSLIDNFSKRLLGLEFKSNHSIKSKCLKWIVKNVLPTI